MELLKSRKSDNFDKSAKFPGIPAGNFRDRRFSGIRVREFPVALVQCVVQVVMAALRCRCGHYNLLGEEAEASPSIGNTLWRV